MSLMHAQADFVALVYLVLLSKSVFDNRIRWVILGGIILLILLILLLAYLRYALTWLTCRYCHARRRVKRGQRPMQYHAWMIPYVFITVIKPKTDFVRVNEPTCMNQVTITNKISILSVHILISHQLPLTSQIKGLGNNHKITQRIFLGTTKSMGQLQSIEYIVQIRMNSCMYLIAVFYLHSLPLCWYHVTE
jgi:hypothetical protein